MDIVNKAEFSRTFREELRQLEKLPPLPESARQLLRLRNQHDATIESLVEVIEQDPSLSSQVLRYGRQSIYGYGERIKEPHQAISMVMGFDLALHFCLGLAAGKTLQCQNNGPLSRMIVWQQALECASLCQSLAPHCKGAIRPEKGLSYLSGLLHNFGYLLFGHLHPAEYKQLNALVSQHPTIDIRSLELHSFGISHDMIGMELMKSWQMPQEIIRAVSEHHFPDFDGEYAIYPKLVALSNRLLETPGMQDNEEILSTASLMASLSIKQDAAEDALSRARAQHAEFMSMAHAMTA